jgi:SEC-C motif
MDSPRAMEPTKEPGRNAACPCGSGKKYKKCCGARVEPAAVAPETPAEVLLLFQRREHRLTGEIIERARKSHLKAIRRLDDECGEDPFGFSATFTRALIAYDLALGRDGRAVELRLADPSLPPQDRALCQLLASGWPALCEVLTTHGDSTATLRDLETGATFDCFEPAKDDPLEAGRIVHARFFRLGERIVLHAFDQASATAPAELVLPLLGEVFGGPPPLAPELRADPERRLRLVAAFRRFCEEHRPREIDVFDRFRFDPAQFDAIAERVAAMPGLEVDERDDDRLTLECRVELGDEECELLLEGRLCTIISSSEAAADRLRALTEPLLAAGSEFKGREIVSVDEDGPDDDLDDDGNPYSD